MNALISSMECSNLILDLYRCSCSYLIVSMFLASISVLVVWVYDREWIFWFTRDSSIKKDVPDEEPNKSTELTSEELDLLQHELPQPLSLMSRIKSARQHAIVDTLISTLTREQLEEEKQIEREQLKAIFNLLQKQEEKFQVSSMEQVREQLGLYR